MGKISEKSDTKVKTDVKRWTKGERKWPKSEKIKKKRNIFLKTRWKN